MNSNKQYEPKILRKLQLSELSVFKDFIKICEENNLQYFLFAGCAIGVERHQGFIPWDDDIDIGMLREDYDKIIKIIREKYSDKYNVLDIDSYKTFPFYNAEIARKGTKNIPFVFRDANVPMGIDVQFIRLIMFLMIKGHEKDRLCQYFSGVNFEFYVSLTARCFF